jgi:ethanolamine ammonia-lyase small subunit
MFFFFRQSFGISRFVALHAVLKKTVYILSCRRRILASPDRINVHSHIADRQQFFFLNRPEFLRSQNYIYEVFNKIICLHWIYLGLIIKNIIS